MRRKLVFLRISEELEKFYSELHEIVKHFLSDQGIKYDADELAEVITYQRYRIPTVYDASKQTVHFKNNLPEYFEFLLTSAPVELKKSPQEMKVIAKEFMGDYARYARETILWGRKSGTMMTNVDWYDSEKSNSAPCFVETRKELQGFYSNC